MKFLTVLGHIRIPATHFRAHLFVTVGVLSFVCMASCLAEGPTIVKREGPLRFKAHTIKGEASIAKGVVFDVVCEVNGDLLKGDWKTVGTVTGVGPERIFFNTDEVRTDKKVRQQSHPATLAYRLPNGLTLPLAKGDHITIMHDHQIVAKRFEWDIHISRGKELVFASSHRHDESPPLSADSSELAFPNADGKKMLFYWSDPTYNETAQTRDQNLPSKLNLVIKASFEGGQDATVTVDETERNIPVLLDGQKYIFVALSSEHSTYGEHEEDADGKGDHDDEKAISHGLECILVKQDR